MATAPSIVAKGSEPDMGMVGVLLAAGGASRFRSSAEKHGLAVAHKLIAPLRGETVFSWSLRNLLDAMPLSPISEILVIQGALDLSDVVDSVVGSRNIKLRIATNQDWALGQATSLALAIDTITAGRTPPPGARLQKQEPSLPISSTEKIVAIESSVAVTNPSAEQLGAMVVGLGDQPFIPAETWAAIANAPIDHQIVVATYGGLRRNPVRIAAQWWDEIPRTGDEGARPLLRSRAEFVHELPCSGDPADIDTVEDLLRWS
jgi:CTP:molybdopterin cytidylyltransferase MocA